MSSTSLALSARPAVLRTGRGQLRLFLGAYALYSMSRHVAVGDVDLATRHAHRIVELERAMAADVEQSVQSMLRSSAMLWLLNHVHLAAQLIVVPGALVWLYRRRAPGYVTLRNTVIATWLLALPVYAAFPVAPPRVADVAHGRGPELQADDLLLQPAGRSASPARGVRARGVSRPRRRPPRNLVEVARG